VMQGETHPDWLRRGDNCILMRDAEIIETELMEISAILDDTIKLERIIAWCAAHPDEVPFALHHLLLRHEKDRS
jgi:hypothetical protein